MLNNHEFLSATYANALEVVEKYEEHKLTGHPDKPPGYVCCDVTRVEELLTRAWPQESVEYYQGMFAVIAEIGLMWDEVERSSPLLGLLVAEAGGNVLALMVAVGIKWKELVEGKGEGEGEVSEFSEIEEIEV